MRQFSNNYFLCIAINIIISLQLISGPVFASGLKTDETVLFFKVDAYQKAPDRLTESSTKKTIWLAPLHAWVYEEENDSLWRNKLIQQITEEIELDTNAPDYQNLQHTLQKTLKMFLVDSQSFKTLNLSIDDQTFSFGQSGSNGHIKKTVELTSEHKKAVLDVVLNEPALAISKRLRGSLIRLIPEQGVSIISDIDDTIKESHVLDKKELIKNTFLRAAKPVKSMNLWYQCLLNDFSDKHKSQAYFHYISASPWQLYPMLDSFLHQYDFPSGSLYLRNFRFKDRSLLNFLQPSTEYKVATISQLIEHYPERDFILIGDSGEHDPEIYGRIQRKFPAQVKKIYIRKIPGSELSEQRFNLAFNDSDRWVLFDQPLISPEYCNVQPSSVDKNRP